MDKTLTIRSHRGPYQVSFENGFGFLDQLKKRDGIWAFDQEVYHLYREELFHDIPPQSIVLLSVREEMKSFETAMELVRRLMIMGCTRSTSFISVGGGIIQDVTGFVASIMMRGLKWTFVPTTLLAQADSCIGSKTSLNFDSFKNALGTFYPPKELFLSAKFLDTLPMKEVFSGKGEIVKLLIMKARTPEELSALADRLDQDPLPNLLYDTLLIKKKYIEEDEFDEGGRKLLNYGHCFGHALEKTSEFAIPHGLAVVAGMIVATVIARQRNWIDAEVSDLSLKRILGPALHADALGMEDRFLDVDSIWQAMKKDKKRTGKGVAIVLPQRSLELELAQDLTYEELEYGTSFLKTMTKPG